MCAARTQLIYYVLLFFMISYSRGIGGVLGYIFGEDSIFNIPNSYIGLVFLLILSESTLSQVLSDTCSNLCTRGKFLSSLRLLSPAALRCWACMRHAQCIVVHKLSLDLLLHDNYVYLDNFYFSNM